jgi:hypothetical protein
MPNFSTINGNILANSGISNTQSTSGTSGVTNISGTSGTNGLSGTSTAGGFGSNGTSGISGSSSNNGTSGIIGIAGTSGVSGLSRTSGVNGANGSSGANGASVPGNAGSSGISGAAGYLYSGSTQYIASGTPGYFAQGENNSSTGLLITNYPPIPGSSFYPTTLLSTDGTNTTWQPYYNNIPTPTPTYTHTFRINRGENGGDYGIVFTPQAQKFTNLYGYNNPASGGNARQLKEFNGTFGVNLSTRKAKNNINYLTDVSWLNDLEPVRFNFRKKDENDNWTEEYYEEIHYGLVAEDVEKINPNLVMYITKEASGTSGATGSSGTSSEDEEKIIASVHYYDLLSPMTLKLQQLDERMKILELK